MTTVFLSGKSDTFISYQNNYPEKNLLFHSNLNVKQKLVKKIPKFYQEILARQGKPLSSLPKVYLSINLIKWIHKNRL